MKERKWLVALAVCAVAFFGLGYMVAMFEHTKRMEALLEAPSPGELRHWLKGCSASEDSLSGVDPQLRQLVMANLAGAATRARLYATQKSRDLATKARAESILRDVEAAEKLVEKLAAKASSRGQESRR